MQRCRTAAARNRARCAASLTVCTNVCASGERVPPTCVCAANCVLCARAATDAHIVTNILCDVSSIKNVRFSIAKDFWAGYEFYYSLPPRVLGQFERWLDTDGLKPKILWDDGGQDTQLTLMDLLAPGARFLLEAYLRRWPPSAEAKARPWGQLGPHTGTGGSRGNANA